MPEDAGYYYPLDLYFGNQEGESRFNKLIKKFPIIVLVEDYMRRIQYWVTEAEKCLVWLKNEEPGRMTYTHQYKKLALCALWIGDHELRFNLLKLYRKLEEVSSKLENKSERARFFQQQAFKFERNYLPKFKAALANPEELKKLIFTAVSSRH